MRTEIGYICPACRNRRLQAFYADFRPIYYGVAALVALPLSLFAGWILPATGWLALFLGPVAGALIAEAVFRAIRRRRGRYTWLVVAGCIVAGGLPWMLASLLPAFVNSLDPVSLTGRAWPLVWGGVYLVTATSAAIARLRV